MICRIWRGWTTFENADEYQRILQTIVMPGIVERNIDGLQRFELMRRELEDEIEFCTIMWFDSEDAVKRFVGEDYTIAHVPDVARAVLKRFDERSVHYNVYETTNLV
ncbi:MAG: antibiotic biosynthesis monooxygenase [Pseudomonadota bacterium]